MRALSEDRHVSTAATLARLALRHGMATAATIVATCVLWTLTYGALLLWAMVTDGGLGGPLAYPGGLVAVALAAAAACVGLFLPATALAEWTCRRKRLPIAAQIPFSVAFLGLLCGILSAGVGLYRESHGGTSSLPAVTAWLFALSLVPIGFYWWIAQAGPIVRAIAGWLTSCAASAHLGLARK